MALIYGPIEDNAPRKPSLQPSNPGVSNGEPDYKKRTGGGIPEKTRETGNGLQKPTK